MALSLFVENVILYIGKPKDSSKRQLKLCEFSKDSEHRKAHKIGSVLIHNELTEK